MTAFKNLKELIESNKIKKNKVKQRKIQKLKLRQMLFMLTNIRLICYKKVRKTIPFKSQQIKNICKIFCNVNSARSDVLF